MPSRHRMRLLLTFILLLASLLVACADEPEQSLPTSLPAEPATEAVPPAELPSPEANSEPVAGNATPGAFVADLGFRPAANGFSFENYGGEGQTNLTPNDLRRLFGDAACASIEGGECLLTPPGQQWLEQINGDMSEGHCEGMAVLSNLFYTGKADPQKFGAATVPALQLDGNELLQREIAYWWATQATEPASAEIVSQTPSGVLNTLMVALAAGPSGGNQYAIGIYKRDRSGGHAITPYAVQDLGNGQYHILVYDNNYPGEERAIEVDTNADTWRYTGSTNPDEPADEYDGDAESRTLEIVPIGPRLQQQYCPFCDETGVSLAGGRRYAPAARAAYNQVWLAGDADLLITDLEGRSIGFRNGVFVNEIPGARSNSNKYGVSVWNVNNEPVYYLPAALDFTISIDATHVTEPTSSTVTLIGPGYALEVSEIILEPGQVDTLDVAPDGSLLSYRSSSSETPYMLVALETEQADYLFGVYGETMAAGEALTLALDTQQGWLSVDTIDNTQPGRYSMLVARYDDQGEQLFGADDIELQPDDVAYIDYVQWPGNRQPMPVDIDSGGDGTVDTTLMIDDGTDQMP